MPTITPEANVVAKKIVKSPQQFVTVEQFSQMTEVLSALTAAVTDLKKNPVAAPTKEAEEIRKATYDQAPINPAWEEKAREIIGEALDHCEIFYPKSGGVIFTVVIKNELSNSPKDYLERMKVDRRSREIGAEGISGVEIWCKLVRANLKRTLAA